MEQNRQHASLGRREFFRWVSVRGVGLGLAATSFPALLQACARATDDPSTVAASPPSASDREGRAVVGDVLDFALSSDDWQGAFGFVTFRLHKAAFDGKDAFYIRTDASDKVFAEQEKLVHVPKIAGLIRPDLTGHAYLVSRGTSEQATVLSSVPGRSDYTPAWRIHRVTWKGAPRTLSSVQDVDAAKSSGDVNVEDTSIVLNAMVVKWPGGEMPVDDERKVYLGPGQLLEAPDTSAMTVMFKLHECFPGVRYIVADAGLQPMAEGMKVAHSPRLDRAPEAGATGRTNVFMNGLEGSGPMGFQPSVFDSKAGDAQWSPYWDHITWAWKDGKTPRALETEQEILAAQRAGDLDKFPGTPDTKGKIFTVNCPVPVLAPNTFTG